MTNLENSGSNPVLLVVDIDSTDWAVGAFKVSLDELETDKPSALLTSKLSQVLAKKLGKPVKNIAFDDFSRRVEYGVSLTFEADGLLCHATPVELFC